MNKYIITEINELNSLTLTLNRPEVHNAFNDGMISEISNVFVAIEKEQKVKRVFITGNGKSFCAGADLNWMKSMLNYSQKENREDSLKLSKMFSLIDNCSVPVIGLINGHALGGGMGLLAVCDYVLASSKGRFGFTEVNLGLIPAVISPFCINKIGISHARSLFLSGEKFNAARAYEINLVHKITDEDNFANDVIDVRDMFEKLPGQALIVAKELIKEVSHLSEEKVHEFTCEAIANQRISAIGQEGMNALLEKRSANWKKND